MLPEKKGEPTKHIGPGKGKGDYRGDTHKGRPGAVQTYNNWSRGRGSQGQYQGRYDTVTIVTELSNYLIPLESSQF